MYLIGGVPRTGKSKIADMLRNKAGISLVSTDALEILVHSQTDPSKHAEIFPKNAMRDCAPTNDEMYTMFTSEEIVDAYKVQAQSVWKNVEKIADIAVRNDQSVIIEGHHLHPALIMRLLQKYPSHIKSVFLVKKNIDDIVGGARAHTTNNNWFVQKTHDESIYPLIGLSLQKYGEFFCQEAKRNNLVVIEMDGDFSARAHTVLCYLQDS